MLAVRYLALAALVVWLGGMIVLGLLVAPSIFGVLQTATSDAAQGRMLAGATFGEILRRFHLLAYGCGCVLILCLLVMKLVGPPPQTFIPRIAIVVIMLGIALYSGIPVTSEIASIQSQVAGPISSLPESDARRTRFDRLHGLSTTLMTINMGLGLVLLYWYVRES
jgi:glucose dehydrogenase